MIFNTHSHINDKIDNLDELVEECLEKGVNKIAVVGYDYDSSVRAIKAAKQREEVYATLFTEHEHIIESIAKRDKLAAKQAIGKHIDNQMIAVVDTIRAKK